MSAAHLERPTVLGRTCGSAAIEDAATVLASINRPEVQLALWQRPRPSALDWIDALNWDDIDDINAQISGPDWAGTISAQLCDAGYLQGADSEALMQELTVCARTFAQLMHCDQLNMRLEVIETDACRKFHMDYVTARLLMPLHGPGTQWTDTAFGSDAPIHQLGIGDVAIFKGRLAVEQPRILHRSPPVGASGETRLLFVLNPARDRASPEGCGA